MCCGNFEILKKIKIIENNVFFFVFFWIAFRQEYKSNETQKIIDYEQKTKCDQVLTSLDYFFSLKLIKNDKNQHCLFEFENDIQ